MLSLFLGIWAGAVIFTGSLGIVQTFEWIVAAVAGVVLLVGLVYGLSELDADRKSLEPVVADAPQDADPSDD